MKKTVLVLMLTSAMGIALNAEIAAECQRFEDVIRKNDPNTLRALASVYQSNKLTMPVDVKAHLVTLAHHEYLFQESIKLTSEPNWNLKGLGTVFLGCGLGIYCLGSILKDLQTLGDDSRPSDGGASRIRTALSVSGQSFMLIGGCVLADRYLDKRNAKLDKKRSTAQRAQEVLIILQLLPTTT